MRLSCSKLNAENPESRKLSSFTSVIASACRLTTDIHVHFVEINFPISVIYYDFSSEVET